LNKPLYNNQIRATEVRLVAEDGQQMGIFPFAEAMQTAKDKGMDLVLITDKTTPPICKIADYGKYLYMLGKKERQQVAGSKKIETKCLKLTYNISDNDIATRVSSAEKLLNKGDKIDLQLRLKGREKYMSDFGKQKMDKFIEKIKEKMEIKIERELKKEPKGLSMTISKK
jgi:translation initiation factor IF-3